MSESITHPRASETSAAPRQAVADRLRVALEISDAARAVTMPVFSAREVSVETKGDGTPVTEADRACEDLIRGRLAEAFPDDAVLGEERPETDGRSGFRWLIDPIDGTFSFTRGVPLWSTLIAVEHRSRPGWACVGVIDLPALDERVHAAAGGGAWHTTAGAEPRPAAVSTLDDPAAACVCVTSSDVFEGVGERPAFDRVRGRVAATRGWSDAYAAVLVATGRAEAALDTGIKPYDIAPWTVIAAEAGGSMTDWAGRPRFTAGNALMTNGALHDALLESLRG